jgi:glutamyl-tRNA synthetase
LECAIHITTQKFFFNLQVFHPKRAALTGKAVSPPVFDVMAVLGREEALARIRDQAA